MNSKTQVREFLACTTFSIALLLFNVAFSFAQTKTINVENEDGKVHLKISKTENGKTVKMDTTFNVTDDMNVDEIIEALGESGGTNIQLDHSTSKNKNEGHKKKQVIMDFDIPELSKADKDKLHKDWNESMEDMRSGIEKMKESLKSIHIHFDHDGKNKDDSDFNFDLTDEESSDKNECEGYSYSYKFSQNEDEEIGSLNDDGHIVIEGNKDETPPKLEKVISTKNGKQIFVYKRSGSAKEKSNSKSSKTEKPDIHNLYYYPNPTNGKFNLSFRSEEKGDLTIQILDSNSKEVFSDRLNNFEGEFSKEIDMISKSKGNYFLKIIQNGKSVTKKIVLN